MSAERGTPLPAAIVLGLAVIGAALALTPAPCRTQQATERTGPDRKLPGAEMRVVVSPAVLLGDEPLREAAAARPPSGTLRLGSVATPEGALLLLGTFRSGQLAQVAARRGRARIEATPLPEGLGRRLDDWRSAQPASLSAGGPARGCGIETATVDVPAGQSRDARAALAPGTYVAVSWVCRFQTVGRWLFKVPPAERATS
jgi:hypothetical protein